MRAHIRQIIITSLCFAALAACVPQHQDISQQQGPNLEVTAYKGPNKSVEESDYDNNICQNYSQDEYGKCMLARGNIVYKDGYFYYPNIPASLPRNRIEPPYEPPAPQPSSPIASAHEEQLEPTSSTYGGGLFTSQQKQKMMDEAVKATPACTVKKYLMGEHHYFRCIAEHWVTGIGIEVVKALICQKQNMIQQIPVSSNVRYAIVDIACS